MLKAKHSQLTDKIQKTRSCARSSARVYASNLSRIHREFLPKTKYAQDLKWLGEKAVPLLTKLKKIENINTQRNLLAASLVALDILGKTKVRPAYVAQIAVLNKKKDQIAQSGKMSEKQAAKYLDWKQILKLRRLLNRTVRLGRYYSRAKIIKSEFTVIQQNLVLHLYTMLPPVRNDWSAVRFLSEKEWDDLSETEKTSSNNLVLARGGYRVYWAKYKTAKKHGVIQQIIPKALQTLLKKHIKFLRTHYPENDHLLLNNMKRPLSSNGLTKFLQRMFYKHYRKKISTTALRSIFLSNKFDKNMLEEQRTIAKAMHHTPATARDYYVKHVT